MGKHTVQSLIDEGYKLHAYCHDPRCQHSQKLDLEALKARLGPDHSMMHDDLAPKLKCSKCGGKKIGLIFSPAQKAYGNPYMKAKQQR